MRITNAFGTSNGRTAVLVVLSLLAVAGTAAAWLLSGPGFAVMVGGFFVVLIILSKTLMEVVADAGHQQVQATARQHEQSQIRAEIATETRATSDRLQSVEEIARTQETFNEAALNRIRNVEATAGKQQAVNEGVLGRVRAVEKSAGDQAGFNEGVLGRVRAVEKSAGDQDGFNEGVLGRVRAVEKSAGDQAGFNEGVLGRVRAVEKSAGDQDGFNEGVLGRVRAVEKSAGDQAGFNEGVLGRVRAVESGSSRRVPPPGQERRLALAREMISDALEAIDAWEAVTGRPVSEDVPEFEESNLVGETSDLDVPLVSVIVTCFNEEQFVGHALESIRRQSFENWECVIVDDASVDMSVAEIGRFVAADERFRLIRQPENHDVSAARNRALREARGAFVVFLDADDLLMADSIQDRLKAIDAVDDPDVAGAFSQFRIGDTGVMLDELPDSEPWPNRPLFADFVSSRGECPFGTPCPLLRRDVVLALGGFNEDQSLAADWEFWLRMMRSGFYFISSEKTTIVYRQQPRSKAQSRAASHVKTGHALIEAAYRPASLGEASALASYPLDKPLPYYEAILTRARRTIQYASTILLRGEMVDFESVLATLEPGSWTLLSRHIDISGKAIDGFCRATGLHLADLPPIWEDLAPLVETVRARVQAASS